MIKILINGRDTVLAPNIAFGESINDTIPIFNIVLVEYDITPKYFEKVEIYDDDILIFFGLVTQITNRSFQKRNLTVEVAGFKWVTTRIPTEFATKPNITANEAIEQLVTISGPEGSGLTGYDINIVDVDDLTQFNVYFENVMTFGSDSIRDSLDRLANLFFAVWWIDENKGFHFKLIDNFEKNVIDQPYNYFETYNLINKQLEEDISQYRNANTIYASEIETSEFIIKQINGQNDLREYILPYKIARDIKIEQSFDGGFSWIENEVEVKPKDTNASQDKMWAWEYGSAILTLNETFPTQPPTTLFKFTYIGLTSTKTRVTNEKTISLDSQRLGVKRALAEFFSQDERFNTQQEIYGQNIAQLRMYSTPKVSLFLTFTKDPNIPLASEIKFMQSQIDIPSDVYLKVIEKTVEIVKEINGVKLAPKYTYHLTPVIANSDFWNLARKLKQTDYEQSTDIVEINIVVDVAYLSIEVDSVLIAESTGELHANEGLFANVDLFAGNEELC